MSEFHLCCGHTTDGHSIRYITKKGGKAFAIFQKYWGKKTVAEIIKKGGGFKEEYISEFGNREKFVAICSTCFSEWSLYKN